MGASAWFKRVGLEHIRDGLLGILALAMIALLPFLDFMVANAPEVISPLRMGRFFLDTLLWIMPGAIVLRVVMIRFPLWHICLALAPLVYLFFSYHEVNALLGLQSGGALLDAKAVGAGMIDKSSLAGTDSARLLTLRISGWAGGLVAIFASGLWLIRSRRTIALFLFIPTALAIPPSWQLAEAYRPMEKLNSFYSPQNSKFRPNIFWLVADGYPRSDVLRSDFGFANDAFEKWLRGEGFTIFDQTSANYPNTIYSVAATLSMTYVVDATTPQSEVKDLARYRLIVRGDNPVVATLRSFGYQYVHFWNGYDLLTQCDGQEDFCIVGTKGMDEVDVAFLQRTPLFDAMVLKAQTMPGEELPYTFGAFDALIRQLQKVRELPSPYFVYAHVISPHPPFRLDKDCQLLRTNPDLQTWKPENRGRFLDQLKCTNQQLKELVREILGHDNDAIIILQSDHGSAFRGQFADTLPRRDDAQGWDVAQVAERFGVLNAIHMPERCHWHEPNLRSLVNTFSVVLPCISGKASRVIPDRRFVTPYGNSAQFGKVQEIPGEQTGTSVTK